MSHSFSKILVTGGAGFIGSHIADKLLIEGYEVGLLDDFSTGSEANLPTNGHLRIHRGDITSQDFVRTIVKDYEIIIHQAALVSVTRSVEDPLRTHRVNVDGTINLLNESIRSNIQLFIYASSSSIYGETEVLPKREDILPKPISPYAASKLAAENYCRVYAKVYGLNTICLRYFNVYGPRQRIGPYSGVIPIFTNRLLSNQPPIIYGDGTQTRDFTYVSDIVQANILCLNNHHKPGEFLNIATGTPTSVHRVAEILSELTGKKYLHPIYEDPRPGDIQHSYAEIHKAEETLGYKPKVNLPQGLRATLNWFSSTHHAVSN